MITYLHLYDIDSPDSPYELYRLLDRKLSIGMIIDKSANEGYIPYEIIGMKHISKTFGDNDLYKVMIKKHPFVKTHCRHEWNNPKPITISQELTRSCSKCGKNQVFEYVLAKWIDK